MKNKQQPQEPKNRTEGEINQTNKLENITDCLVKTDKKMYFWILKICLN